jgi:transcriptional regulator with XRE-family HTH domain
MAQRLSVTKRAYLNYEQDNTECSFEKLGKLKELGADLNHLLTGSAPTPEPTQNRDNEIALIHRELEIVAARVQEMKQKDLAKAGYRTFVIAGKEVSLPVASDAEAKAIVDLGRTCASQILYEIKIQGRDDIDCVVATGLVFKWFEHCLKSQISGDSQKIERIVQKHDIIGTLKRIA